MVVPKVVRGGLVNGDKGPNRFKVESSRARLIVSVINISLS